jgi:hypothetical protein
VTYAISHWHAGWHAIVCLGSFALWVLSHLLDNAWWPSDGGRFEAEERGRKRIMESYDKHDKRDDNE